MMLRILLAIAFIILILAAYPFLNREESLQPVTGLPWQIENLDDGYTQVFGIVPGRSSLAEVQVALGKDAEIAIMQDKDGSNSLEMYYARYRAGLLSGKLVLLGELDADELEALRQRAASKEVMESLARKYLLDRKDFPAALEARLLNIAFIPAVNLDNEIIRERFGEPAETIDTADGATHYLFPSKGLSIALSEEHKEVLQYVAPAEFALLTGPLQAKPAELPPAAPQN